jgi:hypothetical protein
MLPNVASSASYGGAKNDYSAVSDSTTDRAAAAVNPAYGDIAAMTHTAFRAWIRLTLYSSGAAPTIVAHDEVWNNSGGNAAPSVARLSAGSFQVTYPATVVDEIPATSPGYTGPQTVNLQSGIGNVRAAVPTNIGYADLKVVPSSANVMGLAFWKFAGGGFTLGDPVPSSIDVDVFFR